MWHACRVRARLLAACLIAGLVAPAAPAEAGSDLISYIRGRTDLTKKSRARWIYALKKRFRGPDRDAPGPEAAVAKAVLASAIFTNANRRLAIDTAWASFVGARESVPPAIAVHHGVLTLQGEKPRGRMIELAFKFPDYYTEEIAPGLVAYWEVALRAGTIPDTALGPTQDALEVTRKKMRPLLLDKLRLLARLDRELVVAKGVRRAELETDMRQLEDELAVAFIEVARRPEVLDRRKRPYDRLRIQLEDAGQAMSVEDRLLDPESAPPPKKPVPNSDVKVERAPTTTVAPDVEPIFVPPPALPPPPQPRPGDPNPYVGPLGPRAYDDLELRYRTRVEQTVALWLGTPFRWGGTIAGVGTDGSGFVRGVFESGFGIQLPRTTRDQFRVGRSVQRRALKIGDLLFFDRDDDGQVDHVGIYLGDGKLVHAATTKGVSHAKLKSRVFERAYRGSRRLLAYPRQ